MRNATDKESTMRLLDDITIRLRRWTSGCAAITSDEDLNTALDKSQQVLSAAAQVADFSERLPNAAALLHTSSEGLEKVRKTMKTVSKVCHDIQAVDEIHRAVRVLNEPDIIQRNPEAAAKAFGLLFSGVGRLAKRLPEPARSYAEILEACGGEFFLYMQKQVNPEKRWKSIFDEVEGYR
jgi:hypothetical protein